MNDIVAAFLFFLPAGAANMMPVLATRVPMLADWTTPLDFGQSFRGKRLFGSNKTWRGLLVGAIAAGITALLVHNFYQMNDSASFVFWQGVAMGTGALIGDAVESFFKRQRGIGPGTSWFPFDQTDYIIGGLLFTLPFGLPSANFIPIIFGIYFGLHLLFSYFGYLLKLKDKPL